MSCIISGVGRIGKEIEFKTVNGVEIAALSIAVSAARDDTIWLRATIWDFQNNKYLKNIISYLNKGKQIQFSGTLNKVRAFTKNNGEIAASTEIYINHINFITASKSDEEKNTDGISEHYDL